MVQNRIQRYEALWVDRPREPQTHKEAIPPGFSVQLLGHLRPEHCQSIANRKELYQWAYDQARKESDQKLFWDWSI